MSGQSSPGNDREYPSRPLLGVSAAIWRGGDVLLVRRGRPPLAGLWSLPGGLVEAGETLEQAVERELSEETGITATLQGVADWVDIIHKDDGGKIRTHYVLAVFAGLWSQGKPTAGDDAAEACWVAEDAINTLEMTRGTARVIARTGAFLRQER